MNYKEAKNSLNQLWDLRMETDGAGKYIDLNTYYIVSYFKLSNQRLKIVC